MDQEREDLVDPDTAATPGAAAAREGGLDGERPAAGKKLARSYRTSVTSPESTSLPASFAEAVLSMESALGAPVWVMLLEHIDDDCVYFPIHAAQDQLPPAEPIWLLLDTPGGQAVSSYRVARLLQRRCGGYNVLVPRSAKSAGTFLALGADHLVLGPSGELGPLDAQVRTPEREEWTSVLEELSPLDHVENLAEDMAHSMTSHLRRITQGKKLDTLVPLALEFAAAFTRPLLENVDMVRYSKMARIRAEGQAYAERLLTPRYGKAKARGIAKGLVEDYPDHGFAIDREELVAEVGLELSPIPERLDTDLEAIWELLPTWQNMDSEDVWIGRIVEDR